MNLTGQRIGRFIVIKDNYSTMSDGSYYRSACRCYCTDCKQIVSVIRRNILRSDKARCPKCTGKKALENTGEISFTYENKGNKKIIGTSQDGFRGYSYLVGNNIKDAIDAIKTQYEIYRMDLAS